MKNKTKKLCALLFMLLLIAKVDAQQTLDATGGNASGTSGTVSYSIGQMVYTTIVGTNGSIAQRVQQPYEISVANGIEDAIGISLICSIYPNPTSDYLTLKIEGDVKTQYVASLYDITGKLLENKTVENSETSIYLKNLVSAIYFLKVTQLNKELKTFKIIKY
ncbi:MAG: T9SS type A sorting domain-containing protein [Bacteroidota bacterium]